MAGLLVAKDLLFGVRTISGGVQKNAHDLWPWIFFVEQFFPLLVPSAPRGAIRAGTKLATNVSILEYDLVDIGDNCVIENCVIRPFCLETGHMVLDSIVIGAPGTRLAENSVLGPLSSSHEWKDFLDPEIANSCTEVNRVSFTSPSLLVQLFLGYPLK